MKVEKLVELVKMKNGIEVIVYNSTVTKDNYPHLYSEHRPYYIQIEGLFKEKGGKKFNPGHFVVPLYIDHGIGTWSVHCSEGDTYNFFNLSPSNRPEERAEFLHYCLSENIVFKKLEEDFGDNSNICIWVKDKCPISYKDS